LQGECAAEPIVSKESISSGRTTRDRYLGFAACFLAAGALTSPIQNLAIAIQAWSLGSTWWLVDAAVLLSISVGYILATRGFFGPPAERDSKLRRAAQVWIGGNSALMVLATVSLILTATGDGPFSGQLTFYGAISLANLALTLAAAVFVARAFGPRSSGASRNRALAWAVVLDLGGNAIARIVISLYATRNWVPNLDGLLEGVLWASAAAVAAGGLFRFAKAAPVDFPAALARRERRLALGALFAMAVGLLVCWGAASNLWDERTHMGFFGWPSWWALQMWLPMIADVALTIAAALAALGFFRSRSAGKKYGRSLT
jgi:hypothetical protein